MRLKNVDHCHFYLFGKNWSINLYWDILILFRKLFDLTNQLLGLINIYKICRSFDVGLKLSAVFFDSFIVIGNHNSFWNEFCIW